MSGCDAGTSGCDGGAALELACEVVVVVVLVAEVEVEAVVGNGVVSGP